jgi:hypothetical protein
MSRTALLPNKIAFSFSVNPHAGDHCLSPLSTAPPPALVDRHGRVDERVNTTVADHWPISRGRRKRAGNPLFDHRNQSLHIGLLAIKLSLIALDRPSGKVMGSGAH